MIVTERETPSGQQIHPSCNRSYNVHSMNFRYTAPSCDIVTFNDCIAISGSWEHGLAGIIQGDSFYHSKFTKDATNFRNKSPFWKQAQGQFNIDLDVVDFHHVDEIISWFNIGQYWHWFLEDLPLIDAFRKLPGIPIYTNYLTQFQLDSLSFFPDILERVIQVDTPAVLKCKTAHVVTYPAISYRGKSARWASIFLKNNLTSSDSTFKERIYISRNDAVARNVKNEYQLTEMLVKRYGFTIVNTTEQTSMTKMSLQNKVNMFAGAKIVVSPTGAGLTHVHAMSKNSIVIDFNHKFEINEECGWNNIGDAIGLNWNTFAVTTLDMPVERPKPKNSHMFVDVNILQKVIDNALDSAA